MQTTCASLPRKTVTQPLIAGKFRCKRYKNKLQKNQETEQGKKNRLSQAQHEAELKSGLV